jgi:hypothetical protein
VSIDDNSDELLEAMLDLEYKIEESFNWSNYKQMGLIVAVYLSDSPAQQEYRKFMTSPEISLGDGICCARDMAPMSEIRSFPFRLATNLAERQRKNEEGSNGKVEPVIERLAQSSFVGIVVSEAMDDPASFIRRESVKPGVPCRIVMLQTAMALSALTRFRGDSRPMFMTPGNREVSDPPCAGCLLCDLRYLVGTIAARA